MREVDDGADLDVGVGQVCGGLSDIDRRDTYRCHRQFVRLGAQGGDLLMGGGRCQEGVVDECGPFGRAHRL